MRIRLKYKILVLVCVFLFLRPAKGFCRGKQVHMAIIPGPAVTSDEDGTLGVLESQLSNMTDIAFVDRSYIMRVLSEQKFAVGFTSEKKNAPRMGHLLQADILLFIKRISEVDQSVYRIRLVESRSGIVLGSMIEKGADLQGDISHVIEMVRSAVQKYQIPFNGRKYVGILGLTSEEPGSALDGTTEALKTFLSLDLTATESIILLEREHLQHLNAEQDLTPLELKLKASTVVVNGGIKHGSEGNSYQITLMFYLLGNRPGSQKITLTVAADNIEKARKELAEAVLAQLKIDTQVIAGASTQEEAKLFLSQVPLFIYSGEYEKAVSYAEVAYALKPDHATRFMAARTWMALAVDLESKVDEAKRRNFRSAGPGGPKITKTTRATSATSFKRTTRVVSKTAGDDAKKPAPPERTSAPGTPKAKFTPPPVSDEAAQLQVRYLSALIRSYNLLEALSKAHMRDFEKGQDGNIAIPDPVGDLLEAYDAKQRSRERNVPLKLKMVSDH